MVYTHMFRQKELLGYDPSDLIGKSVYDLIHPFDLRRISKAHVKIKDTAVSAIYRMRNKDGLYVFVISNSETTHVDGVVELISFTRALTKFERFLFLVFHRSYESIFA